MRRGRVNEKGLWWVCFRCRWNVTLCLAHGRSVRKQCCIILPLTPDTVVFEQTQAAFLTTLIGLTVFFHRLKVAVVMVSLRFRVLSTRSLSAFMYCGMKSLFGAVWEVFSAGHLIGCLHGSTVTNKGCLNCASILLFQCTNSQWEAWRGQAYRQMHVQLQSTLNAREYFTEAVTRDWIVCPTLKLWPSFL